MSEFKFSDGVKKLFLAGVGAVALSAEKGSELINELVKKGEITVEQGKDLNKDLQRNFKESMDKRGVNIDELSQKFSKLSSDELAKIKEAIANAEKLVSEKLKAADATIEDLAEAAEEKADEIGEAVEEAIDKAAVKADEALADAAETAEEAVDEAAADVAEVAEDVAEAAEEEKPAEE